jgi:hypothetical protein
MPMHSHCLRDQQDYPSQHISQHAGDDELIAIQDCFVLSAKRVRVPEWMRTVVGARKAEVVILQSVSIYPALTRLEGV